MRPSTTIIKKAGLVQKKCEITEKKRQLEVKVESYHNRAKSTVELENEIEKTRSWIRRQNTKLYDKNI